MSHTLSVTVQIDLDGKNARIVVTGCVTEASHRALLPLIHRARTLTADIQVTVDLSGAHHVEASGVDLLRWAIDHDHPRRGRVRLLLPEPGPQVAAEPRSTVAPHSTAGSGHRPRLAA